MHPVFGFSHYLLKRQALALTGKVRIFDPTGRLALYSEQKMFRLRENIRLYEDERKAQQLLEIQARQALDFAAAYDVVDSTTGQAVGTLQRRGWRSMLRDTWEILDPAENVIGVIQEDSAGLALLRRILLGALLPQRYEAYVGEGGVVAQYRQRFHPFRYEMAIDFLDEERIFDRRLGLAAAILLAIIERKQRSQ